MTEGEARAWIVDRFGSSAVSSLDRFEVLLRNEATRQNLVSSVSLDHLWSRHIVDSAQLIPLAKQAPEGIWLDIGTGAGFPGLIVALLCDRDIRLVEPRRRRVDFLTSAVEALGLSSRVRVHQASVEKVNVVAAIISARAVAGIYKLLQAARHCAGAETTWILPRGRSAVEEVAEARQSWHGTFHVEQSVTAADSRIVIASKVTRR